ncbi:hypothetical protein [Undibacterium fentianense]|uniref:Uncharacterized protein n=1 Tax=Undibacterium fentianense TaxID=2828728 RepID=A0A941ICL4_9BURK|nr:hypothetical protein [Undibacterium fentianense]MBR7799008.1 hypothetical protein [Undibacterium fentianense]
MTIAKIRDALLKAEKGITQYAVLMHEFPKVDVSLDVDFQRKYNAFYRVQRRQMAWYLSYYTLMQKLKETKPLFADVLDEIYRLTGRYEPSFASKLVATIDPLKPIWDIHILKNTGHGAPSYASKNKLALAKVAYASLEDWYEKFLDSAEGKLYISEFDQFAPDYCGLTALKKVDFILWQTRSIPAKKVRST